jgi:hypothetical protein
MSDLEITAGELVEVGFVFEGFGIFNDEGKSKQAVFVSCKERFAAILATEPTSLNEENHTGEDEIAKEDEKRVNENQC